MNTKALLTAVVITSLCLFVPSFGTAQDVDGENDYRLGMFHREKEQDEKAVEFLTDAAQQGHTLAQLNLGFMYQHGKGVEQDFRRAISYYQQAGDRKNPDAQFNLALMHQDGQGTPKDLKKAIGLLRRAAENGSAQAKGQLGVMYYHGEGLEVKAVRSSPQADNTKATGSIAFLELGKVIVGIRKRPAAFWAVPFFRLKTRSFEKDHAFSLSQISRNLLLDIESTLSSLSRSRKLERNLELIRQLSRRNPKDDYKKRCSYLLYCIGYRCRKCHDDHRQCSCSTCPWRYFKGLPWSWRNRA